MTRVAPTELHPKPEKASRLASLLDQDRGEGPTSHAGIQPSPRARSYRLVYLDQLSGRRPPCRCHGGSTRTVASCSRR